MGGNYREFGAREPSPMWGFTKSLDAILGPGGNVVLPDVDANIFHHEAELVLVFGKGGKDIPASEAMDHVFGYTCGVDVSARMPATGGGGARAQHAANLGAQVVRHVLPAWALHRDKGRACEPGERAGDAQRGR